METNPSNSFNLGPGDRSVVSVSSGLGSDLLHQAFQEVSVAHHQGQEPPVKLEPEVSEVYNTMEQLMASAPMTPIQPLPEAGVDEVKVEVTHVAPHLGGGGAGPVLMVPTLPDGVLAYAVQPGSSQEASFGSQINIRSLAPVTNVALPVTSPVKSAQRIPVVRSSQKQKVILPKSAQLPTSVSPTQHLRPNLLPQNQGVQMTPRTMPPSQSHQFPNIRVSTGLQKQREATVRKVQLITGKDSESKIIELVTSLNGETSVRCDKPLTEFELRHVKSIIKDQKETGGAKQVYTVVFPSASHSKPETTVNPKTIDFIDLEEDALIKNSDVADSQTFSVAAFVKEFSKRGRAKHRGRGRPRKGTPKVINEKKVFNELRKEFGLREERVKEFGLVEQSEEETRQVDSESSASASRTRSGRLSRPPPKVRNKEDTENNLDPSDEMSILDTDNTLRSVSSAKVEDNIPLPARRNFIPPAKYICKVCGKIYLGDKKIAKHLKHFPSHEFATPEPPITPPKENKRSPSFESYITECDSNKFIEQIGAKLFKSFSLWDLLLKKTIAKRLGTVESLMSLFADMQAIVIELKNLVDQCLTCERSSQDSLRLTLTPIMSAVLGLSQSGSVSRYILPHTQIPEHYHTLLNFPSGLGAAMASSSSEPGLMSPESTTSLMHPEEENSQMSLSSDIMDQPLSEKVVLEDNLCNRQMDMDEETQDSSIAAPSPVPHLLKRTRVDSETEVISPPPQTPDFLSQGDDSNISIISVSVTEPAKGQNVQPKKSRPNDYNTQEVSLHTKLPSFSSIINGGSQQDHREEDGTKETETVPSVADDQADACVNVCTSFHSGDTKTPLITASPLARLTNLTQESFGAGRQEPLGGSAPVSPRVRYGSSGASRRCSLDNTNRSLPDSVILGLNAKLQDEPSEMIDISMPGLNPDTTSQEFAKHDTLPSIAVVSTFPLEDGVTRANMKLDRVTEGAVVTSYQYQAMITTQSSQQEYFPSNAQSSEMKTFVARSSEGSEARDTFSPSSITSADFEQSIPPPRSSILKAHPPKGSSTHVTFSEGLSHPIPSVSPAKDFREIDLKRQNPTPPSESQSSSIFSDLESVLNEASDFTFHAELGEGRCQVKTPEKLLQSVPPAAVMNKKTAISFNNILNFEKSNDSKQMQNPICQSSIVPNDGSSNSIAVLPQNILENPSNYPYPGSSSESGNC